jgi:hypothetical protein
MIFGLKKELGKCRMRLVGAARIEGDLSIACKVQRSLSVAAIGQSDAADFRVGVRHDRDLVTSLNVSVAAADDCPTGAQVRLVVIGVSSEGLSANGPSAAIVQIADVTELAPAVARAIFSPAGYVYPIPDAVAAP